MGTKPVAARLLSDALKCTGPDGDPLRDGFKATSLDQDEVERILDACIKHSDHWSGFKVATMVLLGTAMGFRGAALLCLVNLQSEQMCAHEQCVTFAR